MELKESYNSDQEQHFYIMVKNVKLNNRSRNNDLIL